MGDCRMRILISKDLPLPSSSSSAAAGSQNSSSSSLPSLFHPTLEKVYSADTTVREVADDWLWSFYSDFQDATRVRLWDCTLHPPKDISDWPCSLYPHTKGPGSKTLFEAGWFPSGTLQLLPKHGHTPSTQRTKKVAEYSLYEDAQYNVPLSPGTDNTGATVPAVQLKTTTIKNGCEANTPSMLLQSVTERFRHQEEDSTTMSSDPQHALSVRRQRQVERRHKERKRNEALEARLQKLQTSSTHKNKVAAGQVQKMLLKSRCTGNQTLKEQDRVYLYAMVLVGDVDDTTTGAASEANYRSVPMREEFRYFSRQDTVARVVAALGDTSSSSLSSQQQAELLVRWKRDSCRPDTIAFRRLPLTMRLYTALEMDYLRDVDTVVIRCFSPPDEEATTSVLDATDETTAMDEEDVLEDVHEEVAVNTLHPDDYKEIAKKTHLCSLTTELSESIMEAIHAMDEKANNNKTKKKSAATLEKVRTMKLKSRANGDAKRIPKVEQRFFLELVVVKEDEQGVTPDMLAVFLSRSDPVGRLLRDCVQVPAGHVGDILTLQDGTYRIIPQERSLDECETSRLLQCFGRVIVYLHLAVDVRH